MKRIFFSLLLCSLVSLCNAQQTLNLWFNNGDKMLFSLDDNIRTTFQNGDIIISSDVLTVSYPLSDVQKYTFQDSSSDVKSTNSEPLVQIKERGNLIDIHNLRKGSIVDVYTTEGKRIIHIRANSSVTSINIREFNNGIYICKIGSVSYKFFKS